MSSPPDFLIHVPPNELPAIEAIYVFVSVDERGDEGVMGVNGIPAVFAADRLLPLVEEVLTKVTRAAGRKKLRLLKFSRREVVKEIDT
jgi:hypothetical protein